MTVKRFEDLDVWKRAAKLSADIYKQLSELRDFGFRDQITRAGLSISSNIAEGFERMSAKEKLTFMYYAKGSCGELRSQTYIGMDIGYIEKEIGQHWIKEALEISAMLAGLIKAQQSYVKKNC
jgi:four helix bundle protein